MKYLFVAVTLFFIPTFNSLDSDYYWRDYFGSVPEDAVLAGQDLDSNKVYIGQAYVKNAGIVVGGITSGAKTMKAPYGGVAQLGKYIKILCGPQENFYWLPANSTNLHVKILGERPVIGGHDDVYGYLNIGRISIAGETKVGKIASFWIGNSHFFYVDGNQEKLVTSYEILMYRKPDIDARIVKFEK